VSTTRQALRQEIGRLTGDMLKCTATANGSTTSLIDDIRLYRGDGKLTGRIGWVAYGATNLSAQNLYSMVRVTGNTRSTFTVRFNDTALTQDTAEGDIFEFWNTDSMGFYPDDVNAEINSAIAACESLVTEPDEETIDDFDSADPYIDIPADWAFFGGARYEDTAQGEDGIWMEIDGNDQNLEIDARNRKVRLMPLIAGKAHGYRVRLYGDIPSTALTLDTQSTSVDPEWLTAYVSYRLLLPQMRRTTKGDDDVATRMAFCKQVADAARGKARNRPQGMARRLY
jgi:hypothetical protein